MRILVLARRGHILPVSSFTSYGIAVMDPVVSLKPNVWLI
jgi:hypothetical protein